MEKIKRDCRVGQTIKLEDEQKKIIRFPKRATQWVAAAAAAVVIMSGATYGYNNAYAYSYVTLDANPSIEYVLNRRNQVLRVEALNEDAETIVEELKASGVRKESLSDAIQDTMDLLYEKEYLGEDQDNCVLINVSSRGESQKESLTEEANGAIGTEELSVYVTNSTRDEDGRAEKLGLSAGRYVLMQDIVNLEGETADTITEESAKSFTQAPVRELLERSGRREAPQDEPGAEGMPQDLEEVTAPEGVQPEGQMPEGQTEQAQTEPAPGNSQNGQPGQNGQPAQNGQPGQNSQPAQNGETGTEVSEGAVSPAGQGAAAADTALPAGNDPIAGAEPDNGMPAENGNVQAGPAENGVNPDPGTGMGQDGSGVLVSGEMRG